MDYKRGQIVSSKAGHDKGCFFAIIADENPYALICDGKRRPLEKPKKKNNSQKNFNVKHVVIDVTVNIIITVIFCFSFILLFLLCNNKQIKSEYC